jgi:hypothetical protein
VLRMMSVLAIALLLCARPSVAEFTSYAIVRNDGSLIIRNNVVRLFGVYIPDPGQFCDARTRAGKPKAQAMLCPEFLLQVGDPRRSSARWRPGGFGVVRLVAVDERTLREAALESPQFNVPIQYL